MHPQSKSQFFIPNIVPHDLKTLYLHSTMPDLINRVSQQGPLTPAQHYADTSKLSVSWATSRSIGLGVSELHITVELHTLCLISKGIGNHSANRHVWTGFTFSCWLTKPLIRNHMSIPSWFFSKEPKKRKRHSLYFSDSFPPPSLSWIPCTPHLHCRIRRKPPLWISPEAVRLLS